MAHEMFGKPLPTSSVVDLYTAHDSPMSCIMKRVFDLVGPYDVA
jgi:hypothetical protein